ncbi:MAG TPA: hypothetical protein VJ975_10470 [Candidatus Limnocylindria bacterium]|nr:hypothetical protein [Candidatus Limnocylindria bacterium]
MSVMHRVRLPVGATVLVEVGHSVEPAEVLATRRPPSGGVSVPIASRLRRSAADAAGLLAVRPGTVLDAGERMADDGRGREVLAPQACLFLAYDVDDGTALVAPLGATEPILGHVRGEVTAVMPDAIEIRVAGALVAGIGGSGKAVHGELRMAVHEAGEELRAGAIDVSATGRILVGGSRASAEALTRARAMGVAGIVVGGVLDKELRDFEATQRRRREVGGARGDLAIVIVEGFGKVGIDAELFNWFQSHEGRVASIFGEAARVYVYEADPPPARRVLPRPGSRVLALRRPFAGIGGELLRVLDHPQANAAGVLARTALVRFEDGRTAVVPLANLEATEPHAGG